ncbi:MAG: helix-turn-helix domain-containing protein [Anaerostipes sp.]
MSLTNQVQRKNENLAQEIKRYLHKNFNSQGLSIESLCKHFSCSRGTLINHFKTRYHVTIHHYLLELRLKESCELLKNPNLSIKEIAIQCGFSDPNYYSKAFKKMYQRSPLQYRTSLSL